MCRWRMICIFVGNFQLKEEKQHLRNAYGLAHARIRVTHGISCADVALENVDWSAYVFLNRYAGQTGHTSCCHKAGAFKQNCNHNETKSETLPRKELQ